MWVLADLLAGGAGVGEVISWDPEIPEDGGDSEHESDDEKCPEQDPQCPNIDCNGNFLGLCTTPPNENCPCNQCPPVDELECSAELCTGAGEDKDLHGTCTADGSLKDCPCSYPPCPVVRVELSNGQVELRPSPPLCADCGGPIGLGIPQAIQCKGIKADQLAYAADPSRDSPFIWDLDKTLHLAGSSCNVSAPSARQEEPGWVTQYDYLKPPSVAAAIQDFCNTTQGEIVSSLDREYEVFLVATPQDDYPERRVPVWLSVRLWDDRPASHECSSTDAQSAFSVEYNECTAAFSLANWACSDNTLHLTRGGSQPGYWCVVYSIVGYTRDYRLMAAQATQGFLEAWSGGGSSKWNGTEAFKGNRTAKAGGQQKPKGDKQSQGKALFE
ncbi:hypothetical protein QBC40DRAFT_166561 [Triangularia verruculosa]|uniref:Uncharacterized protein n=1 Tax=Triangularia verruculosa TaxID=2587418 RepID=A0AAN7AYK7_9PEZI|nr:hypothetical protein QBC40DRAFT_166561 [Triangularia verruculosa]